MGNAETQRRRDAKKRIAKNSLTFASLRLCVFAFNDYSVACAKRKKREPVLSRRTIATFRLFTKSTSTSTGEKPPGKVGEDSSRNSRVLSVHESTTLSPLEAILMRGRAD